ncbi:MAG: hypothetical protein ACOH15_11365 [Acetobacterium sp.]
MTTIIGCLDVLLHKPRGASSADFTLRTGPVCEWEPAPIPVAATSWPHGKGFKKVSE